VTAGLVSMVEEIESLLEGWVVTVGLVSMVEQIESLLEGG